MDFQEQLKKLHQEAKKQTLIQTKQAKQQIQKPPEEISFTQAMQDVTPIKTPNQYIHPVDKSPIKPRKVEQTLPEPEDYFYIGEGVQLEIPNSFSKNGQGANDIKRLQTGYYEVVADVDLHGYSQDEAQQVLNEFIIFVQQRGVCGEIIHGSGLGSRGYTPVLKTLVRRWLMMHPDVLAYCEPRKGNDGAVRILVKRRRQPDPFAE